MSKLVIFDVDKTITEEMNSTVIKPEVLAWFAVNKKAIDADRLSVALATNQGGVTLRWNMERDGWGDPKGLPTEEMVLNRLAILKKQMHPKLRVYVAFGYVNKSGRVYATPLDRLDDFRYKEEMRKPNPGMLLQAINLYHTLAEASYLSDVTFVGDSEEDAGAAQNAGVRFVHISEFDFETRY